MLNELTLSTTKRAGELREELLFLLKNIVKLDF